MEGLPSWCDRPLVTREHFPEDAVVSAQGPCQAGCMPSNPTGWLAHPCGSHTGEGWHGSTTVAG